MDGNRIVGAAPGLRQRGTTRVSCDGKSIDHGSAEDLLARIRTIERAIAARPGHCRSLDSQASRAEITMMPATVRPRPIATVAPRAAARRVLARQAFETLAKQTAPARGRTPRLARAGQFRRQDRHRRVSLRDR
ncbi:hypothetical protein ACFQBU_19520, partial [Jhaorihella thermophila]